MSENKVEVCLIDNILPHPNADRLEIVQVKGWNSIVRKGEFKNGDKCVYIPIDSILPTELENLLFPLESKIKLSKSRIRTIKLRGIVSQGLVIPAHELEISDAGTHCGHFKVGTNVTKELGITKYEPPETGDGKLRSKNPVSRKKQNPYFIKYTDIENIKNYPNIFEEGERVHISEKIHGTSFRCGWLPISVNSLWKRILKFFKLLPEYEFCYGSRNVQLQEKSYKQHKTGYYADNVYLKIVEQYNLKEKLLKLPGMILFGEIVGDGIQNGYMYGCKKGEHRLYVYDLCQRLDTGNIDFCDAVILQNIMKYRLELETVPFLKYMDYNYLEISQLVTGKSLIGNEIREGIVIRTVMENVNSRIGRKILKFVSDEYLLLKDNTDFH